MPWLPARLWMRLVVNGAPQPLLGHSDKGHRDHVALVLPLPATTTTPLRWPIDLPPLVSLIRGDVPLEVVAQSLLSPRDVDLCQGRLDFRPMLEAFVRYAAMGDALVITEAQLEVETKARLELESNLQVTRKDWGTRYDQTVALYAQALAEPTKEVEAEVLPSSPCASGTGLAADTGLLPYLSLGLGTTVVVPLDHIHILEGMDDLVHVVDAEARDF
nr:uncharacterized protein LOC109181117 [Ipomoea batatas]